MNLVAILIWIFHSILAISQATLIMQLERRYIFPPKKKYSLNSWKLPDKLLNSRILNNHWHVDFWVDCWRCSSASYFASITLDFPDWIIHILSSKCYPALLRTGLEGRNATCRTQSHWKTSFGICFVTSILAVMSPATNAAPNNAWNLTQ